MRLGWIALGLAATGLLTLPAIAGASTAAAGQTEAQPSPSATSSPTPGSAANGAGMPGKQVFQDVCGSCHDLTVSTDQTKSREDWQATVSRMVNSGAPLSDEQAAEVVDYLAKNYGTR